jgi:uncharacterized protein (TIGR03435 family)
LHRFARILLAIRWAYDVLSSQLTGAPGWVGSEGWDIAAKGGDAQFDEIRMMVQRLLEDRFRLRYHWETKEALVYDLVVNKADKLQENTVRGDCPSILSAAPSAPTTLCVAGKLTAGELAGSLSFFLNRPVLDKTA